MTNFRLNNQIDQCAVLTEDTLNEKIIKLWSKEALSNERFYQTGYETILYNQNHYYAIETVITSVLSWDKELLLLGSSESCVALKELVQKHAIAGHLMSDETINTSNVANALQFYPEISHVLIHIESVEWLERFAISDVLKTIILAGREIIVSCDTSVTGLDDVVKSMITYLVGQFDATDEQSFVVARRNKLVQTEGNARSVHYDLYANWQWSMRKRTSVIEPMLCQ
jgi:hypothetical protein